MMSVSRRGSFNMLNGQKMSSLVGSYGAINSDSEGGEETPIVKHERATSYLLASNDSIVIRENKRLKPHEKVCRIVTFSICVILFILSAGGFTTSTILPKGTTQESTIQDSVLTLLTRLDIYYFDVKVTQKPNNINMSCNISVASCSDLQTFTKVHNDTGKVIGDNNNQQLIALNKFSYLLSGSLFDMVVNITSSQSQTSNDVSFLYVFTDLNSYQLFGKMQSIPKNYFKRFDISSGNTKISLPITDTGFYFYGLSLSNGTQYSYSYSLKQVFYNATNTETKCELSSKMTSCRLYFDAGSFSNDECILSYCTEGNASKSFYELETELIRKPITSLSASLLTLTTVMLIIVLSILTYDAYRRYCDPKISTWDTCICKWKK